MLANKLMGGSEEKLYVDDVFSTFLYTGNGSTQTINNGIDLAGKGGLVWIKGRSAATSHALFDTARGVYYSLESDKTTPSDYRAGYLEYFYNNGFGLAANGNTNTASSTYTSWTFRKAPKFFDVVTYTGVSGARSISHALGVQPGMIICKRTDTTEGWAVYHKGNDTYTSQFSNLGLESTAAATNFGSASVATASTFNPNNIGNAAGSGANQLGGTYVAYLFAHDPSADGIIQCGSVAVTGTVTSVNLGWEPQFVLYKKYNGTGDWKIVDTARGFTVTASNELLANASSAETSQSITPVVITGTGFTIRDTSNYSYIYLAIRRPNKPPTSGTEVYIPSTLKDANNVWVSNFPVDFGFIQNRSTGNGPFCVSRLQGAGRYLQISSTSSEFTGGGEKFDNNYGLLSPGWSSPDVFQFFRRAPGFFDVVCYTGTGVARTVPHNLGVAPELVIVKRRSSSGSGWNVFAKPLGSKSRLQLQLNDGSSVGDYWNSTDPTSTVFTVGTTGVNVSADTYVAYLFASLAGISKVGSYTGNGTNQTINCGFTTGARFILVKRTDSTGDWYVWDTARGIVAANDPRLSLNTTAAEVTTDDSVDPASTGFIVNQNTATNINVNGASYIYLAIS